VNLATIIEPHDPDAVALRYDGLYLTYGQLRRRCGVTRSRLVGYGIGPGDAVALAYPTTPDFAIAYFAILGVGAIAVPLNPESPLPELSEELAAVRAQAVMLGGPRAESLRSAIEELGYRVIDLDEPGEAAATGEAAAPPIVERAPDDTAVLLFTSGTAGSPKAAILSHANLLANIDQMGLAVGLAATAVDVGVLVVPPFHIYGLNAVLGVHLYAGGSLVLMERFDAASLLEAIVREKVTVLPGVPQLFAALATYPDATGSELESVRLACSGAAPLSQDVAERFEGRFGVRIFQAYGLTEASPTVSFPDLGAPPNAMSVGVPLPGIEVRIVDADGHPVEHGDPGEILVKGPNVFSGYFEDEVATHAVLDRQGWLHTGDVAVMDDHGSITIVDRNKDLVIVSGFNVFPAEVEHVLEEHPGVKEAVVIGVPDPVLGESVRAFVMPSAEAWPDPGADRPSVTESDLIDHCARRLARYKCPSSIVFVRELPHGIQGKVLRRALA